MKSFIQPHTYKKSVIPHSLRANDTNIDNFEKIHSEALDPKISIKMNKEINYTSRNWHYNDLKALSTQHQMMEQRIHKYKKVWLKGVI
jgi:hypothetical protein